MWEVCDCSWISQFRIRVEYAGIGLEISIGSVRLAETAYGW